MAKATSTLYIGRTLFGSRAAASDLLRSLSSAAPADIGPRVAELEALPAEELLALALDQFGTDAVISTAFGAGGLVLLDLAQRIDPRARAYYLDTGFTFPETDALVRRWIEDRGLNLEIVRPELTPEAQAEQHGDALWARDPDRCCALRKVEPNERVLSTAKLWIAALRRDESPSRASTPVLQWVTLASGRGIWKLCPLVRWTKKEVWKYIFQHALPYNPLHDRGYPSIGCTHCTRAVGEGEDERAGRWAGSSKQECGLHVEPSAAK